MRTMVFDSDRNRTVLVGGEGPNGHHNDTWEYDGLDWRLVNTAVSPPPPSAGAAMAYDEARSRTVLTFQDDTSQLQTWEYDGSNWEEIDTTASPLGRWAHTMAYDTVSQRVILFGGNSPDLVMNDTWEYDGNTWMEITTPNTPPPADQHSMAFDTRTGRIIVLNWGETWVYSHHEVADECPFAEFRVHPGTIYLRDGKTSEQLRIEVLDSESRPVNPDLFEIEFTSSDPDLVQVSPEGSITSSGYGHAQIVVTMAEPFMKSTVYVNAGHLRTAPLFQYLSVNGQSTGRVWPDMGNADGSPVDLDGREISFECNGCEPGQPLQIDAEGNLLAVRDFEEGDSGLAVSISVDGEHPENDAIIHVSEADLGLTLKEYVTHDTIISSPIEASGWDLDAALTDSQMPQLFAMAYQWQRYLMGDQIRGGQRLSLVNYTSWYRFDGAFPGCAGNGAPIRIGTPLEMPNGGCFFTHTQELLIVPQFGIAFHEMGHNMTWDSELFPKFATGSTEWFAYNEGMATAAGMFACEAILRTGVVSTEIAEFLKDDWLCWQHGRAGNELEEYIASGADYSTINPNLIDEMLWNLVKDFDFGLIYRLFGMFALTEQADYPFEIITSAQQATMFAVGCSVAAGVDLKSRFRDDWGFPIEDTIWDEMYPVIEQMIKARYPASNAGADKRVALGAPVLLDDVFVFDREQDELTLEWVVKSKPLGSNAEFSDPSTLKPMFAVDRVGEYILSLRASDQWVQGEADLVTITVFDPDVIFSNSFER